MVLCWTYHGHNIRILQGMMVLYISVQSCDLIHALSCCLLVCFVMFTVLCTIMLALLPVPDGPAWCAFSFSSNGGMFPRIYCIWSSWHLYAEEDAPESSSCNWIPCHRTHTCRDIAWLLHACSNAVSCWTPMKTASHRRCTCRHCVASVTMSTTQP